MSWEDKVYKDTKSKELVIKRHALISWVNEQLDFSVKIMQAFNPSKRDENYANWQVKEYLRYAQIRAVMEDSLRTLTDTKSTQQMYDNIEYMLCKLYEIKYLEELETYA